MQIKKFVVASFAAVMLAAGVAGTASAQPNVAVQDGLVNVAIGDVTILEDVLVNVAADLVVQACGLDLDVVLGIIADIDAGDTKQATFCKVETGKVKVTQNNN